MSSHFIDNIHHAEFNLLYMIFKIKQIEDKGTGFYLHATSFHHPNKETKKKKKKELTKKVADKFTASVEEKIVLKYIVML